MPTRKKSASSLKPSSRVPNKRAKRSRVAGDIIAGLKEAVAFSRGQISLPVRMVYIPAPVNVREIRSKSGLSQSEFASIYGFNCRTLQDWEQGRVQPDAPIRAYLTVIDRNPEAVTRALRSGEKSDHAKA
jgi:putative transcriptional regulator